MKSRIVFFISLMIFLGAMLAFYGMGAFDDPTLRMLQREPVWIAGQYFEGKLSGEAYQQIQTKVQQDWQSGQLKGDRCVYFFNNPDTSRSVRAIVGVLCRDSLQGLPSGYAYHALPRTRVVETILYTSRWIAPNPQEIYVQMTRFAQENDAQLGEELLEIHTDNGEIITQVALKNGL